MHVESLASKAEPGDHFVGLIGTVSDRLQYLVFEKKDLHGNPAFSLLSVQDCRAIESN